MPSSELDLNGAFNCYRQDRSLTRVDRGGGIVVLCPKTIKVVLDSENTRCTSCFEAICLKVSAGGDEFLLVVLYRPPRPIVLNNDEYNEFLQFIAKICDIQLAVIMVGDFNLPMVNWGAFSSSSAAVTRFLDLMSANAFSQHVKQATRGANILDIVLSNEPTVTNCATMDPFGSPSHPSDHRMVEVDTIFSVKSITHKVRFLNFRKANYSAMERHLLSISWPDTFNDCANVSQMWDKLYNVLSGLIKLYVPKSCASNGKMRPPWSHKLQRYISIELRLRRRHRANINSYYARTAVSKIIRRMKREESRNAEQAVLLSGNPRKFWSFIKSKLKARRGLPTLSANNGGHLFTDQQKADAFSKLFSSYYITDDGRFPKVQNYVPGSHATFGRPNFSEVELVRQIKLLSGSTARGTDGIPNVLLKRLSVSLAQPLSSIFTISYYTGLIPEHWSQALVTPVPKETAAAASIEKYRPISLTSCCCKLMERCLRDTILNYCNNNGILSAYQHGFVPGRSVESQLLDCLNQWTGCMDSGKPVDVIYFDISKAFDTVPHQKLLHKLQCLGFGDDICNWVNAYLCRRTQQVMVGNYKSNSMCVTSGVPQGSVLGPILFLLYINDLPEVVQKASISMFADDIKLYLPITSQQSVADLQQDISNVVEWITDNQLKLSPLKTVSLHLLPLRNPNNVYKIGDVQIKQVTSHRDLGVTMDDSLTFKPHIKKCVYEAMRVCNVIRRCFSTKTNAFRRQLFITFVRPKVEFANIIWSPTGNNVGSAKDIEKVQRKYTKQMVGLFDTNYCERLEQCGLQLLATRRCVNDLMVMYKIINGQFYVHNLDDMVQRSPPSARTRGHSCKLLINRSNSAVGESFWFRRTAGLWNSLSEDTVSQPNIKKFRRVLLELDVGKIQGQIYKLFPNLTT